jgi:hypothetical protein
VVDAETHTLYRSAVEMLIYLVKFSIPEISNVARKTAKVNIGPTKTHRKSLYRLVKFVVDIQNYGLVMKPKQPTENNVWEIMAYCDSDYAGDKSGKNS